MTTENEDLTGTDQEDQENSGVSENKTETKPAPAPKGHLSKEDWTALGRKEDDWQSPEEYTERQGALKKSVRDLEARLAAKEKHLDRIEVVTQKALRRIRDKDIADLQTRQLEAAALADVDTVARLRGEEIRLQQSFAEEDRQAQPKPLYAETQAWMARNPDFLRDPVFTEKARAAYDKAEFLAPLASETEKLAYVDRMMGNPGVGTGSVQPRPSSMPDVHGGTRQAAPVKKHSAATLDADALKEGAKFVKMGLFKTIDEYAKAYHEDA